MGILTSSNSMAPGISLGILKTKEDNFHKILVLIITFLAYASLHASRKPPSIVKSVLGPEIPSTGSNPLPNSSPSQMGWAPFNGPDGTHRLGELDLAFLLAYAVGMFFSGRLADNADLRLVLSAGMLLSGVFTLAFGAGYWFNVHMFWYYVVVQLVCGAVQSAGWPCVVAAVGNWWGRSTKKGLVMGIWNSHTSVGNILGSIIAASMLKNGWGWSFFWPGLMVILMAVLVYLFLVVSPAVLGVHQEVILNANSKETDEELVNVVPDSNNNNNNADETEQSTLLNTQTVEPEREEEAIGFLAAWRLPGVASFAVCLFFSKLVAYTFLYWLPFYIRHTAVAGKHLSHEEAGMLSTIFDIGGVVGGVVAGVISDKLMSRAVASILFLVLSVPALILYRGLGSMSKPVNIVLMLITGLFVNGPYALITTAVAADLGTQRAIQGNARALATVTSIIDGTGSIGAAIGPVLVGYISTSGWDIVFRMLVVSMLTAAVFLFPVVLSEIREWKSGRQANGAAH